jgi:lipid-A-disaccharide synthase
MTLDRRRIMISCGEASGDLYAGALVDALQRQDARVDVFGFGGPKLAAAGADLIGDYAGFAVTGLVEAASVLARSRRMLQSLGDAARDRRPDVFVAVDFPDFNFRLLPVVHALGIPIVYYVSPQLWAWRAGRMATIKQYVSRMRVIFPFEQAIYEKADVPVEFVGHPLVDMAVSSTSRDAFLARHRLDPTRPVVALLPGSRPNELRRMLPVFARALPLISSRVPGAQFVVARAPSLEDRLFAPLTVSRERRSLVTIVEQATDDVLNAANVVITASGTATVQTALHGRPMVIVYGLSPLTYAIGRMLVRVPAYGMVNLVAGRRIVPELIQREFTPARVADEAVSLLTDSERARRMTADLGDVRAALGGSGASTRAAAAVLAAARAR